MKNGKIIRFDYDFIQEREAFDFNTAPCLTNGERHILLSMMDYVGWKTRWVSPSGQTIDQNVIDGYEESITNKLMSGGCEGMVDCADIWTCLGIDVPPDDLLTWLQEQLGNNPDIINIIINPGSGGGATAPASDEIMVSGCDLDQLFAFITQLVQFCNLAVTNAYEKFEALTNWVETSLIILDEIPLLSWVVEYIQYMQETILENYLAEYDVVLEEQYIHDLFCLAQKNQQCGLTWFQVYEYFMERFGAGVAQIDIIDLLEFIVGGEWSGTEFCDLSLAVFCGVMNQSGEWFGITLEGIKHFWDTWLNDSNSDWELGEECQWSVHYDFAEADFFGWSTPIGEPHSNGDWWATVNVPGQYCKCVIERTFSPAIAKVDSIWCDGPKIQYSHTHSGAGVYLTATHAGGTYTDTYLGNPDGSTVEFDMPVTLLDVTYIKIEVREDLVGDGGFGYTQGVVIVGRGSPKPPEPEDY